MSVVPYRFKLRRGTTAAWEAANPVLLEGEPGLDTTLGTVKYGDGVTAWLDLPYSTIGAEGIQDVVGAMIVAAGGTYDDEAGTITLPSSGGSGGNVVLVDNGDGTWTLLYGDPDTTPPTPGTLTATGIGETGFTLTVTGATDETGLHAAPYAFAVDGGPWSDWQAAATYEATGLAPATEYSITHKVRDTSGNEATGTAITATTAAGIAFDTFIEGTYSSSSLIAAVDLSTAAEGSRAFVLISRYGTTALTAPGGWTLLASEETDTSSRRHLYTKVLGSADLTVHTWTSASGHRTSVSAATYLGIVSLGTPVAQFNNTYSTSIPSGPLTTSSPWVVGFVSAYAGASAISSSPSGWSLRGAPAPGDSNWTVASIDTNGDHGGGATNPTLTAPNSVNKRWSVLIELT